MNIELHTKASKRYIQVGEEVNCIRSHCSILKKKAMAPHTNLAHK